MRLGFLVAGRLYHWSFRRPGISEATRLVAWMSAASVVFWLVLEYRHPRALPRSVYAPEFFLTVSLVAVLRFGPRILETWYGEWQRVQQPATLRTIIVGAGQDGDLLARDLLAAPDSKYHVVGFVDDAVHRHGMTVSGKWVLGSVSELPRLIAKHKVSTVLLALPELPAQEVRALLNLCASSKASFKTIPASYATLAPHLSAAMLHDLSPDDLLSRDPVTFDYQEVRRLVAGRKVLVTGAGGTIGGEICDQLARNGVSQLVMVDMNENELYLRARRLEDQCPELDVRADVADIRDLKRLMELGERHRPEFVFHAAAHKHVPLMEDAPGEAVKNNVFGTLNVALMADRTAPSGWWSSPPTRRSTLPRSWARPSASPSWSPRTWRGVPALR
jgi:FlaA1/EpsC-like NDP-sugar epimerase